VALTLNCILTVASFTLVKERQDHDFRVIELQYVGVNPAYYGKMIQDFNCPLPKVVAPALCSECAWRILGNALQPYANSQGAVSLIEGHAAVLASNVNKTFPGMKGPALWLAARNHSNKSLLEELVNLGADLRGVDAAGSTALHMAAFYGNTACVRYLLEADSERKKTATMVDKLNHTAWDMCQRHPEVVALFKEFDAIPPEASKAPGSSLRALRTATPDITAREVCGLIGLIPTPRSYIYDLHGQESPTSPRRYGSPRAVRPSTVP